MFKFIISPTPTLFNLGKGDCEQCLPPQRLTMWYPSRLLDQQNVHLPCKKRINVHCNVRWEGMSMQTWMTTCQTGIMLDDIHPTCGMMDKKSSRGTDSFLELMPLQCCSKILDNWLVSLWLSHREVRGFSHYQFIVKNFLEFWLQELEEQ